MSARDNLRRYLEQRRELGEREFVLDRLTVEEALRILGDRSVTERPAAPASDLRRTADEAARSGDWRAALRAIGAPVPEGASLPPKRIPEPVEEAPPPPSPPVPPAAPAARAPRPRAERVRRLEMPAAPGEAATAHPNAPPGLTVGLAMGDLLGGPLAELESLDAIARAVASCTQCPLHSTATNPVPGEGNPRASFVCVGEAPGATEDATGRPFVGQAGQLLDRILAAIGFAREDVFICNVIKHRPPGNRNPAPDEIRACAPFLLRQLELLQARVILALGTIAAQTLLQTSQPIGKLRGQVHRYYGVPLVVTYHPAALLRNPNWKRPTWEDVQLARRVFDSASAGG